VTVGAHSPYHQARSSVPQSISPPSPVRGSQYDEADDGADDEDALSVALRYVVRAVLFINTTAQSIKTVETSVLHPCSHQEQWEPHTEARNDARVFSAQSGTAYF